MPAFTIFVEGADTEPAKIPVCVVDGEKYASRICEGMKETEYAAFNFSFELWTKSDLGKAPAWVVMIEDAQNGVYGEIVAGICNLAERMYLFMGGRRRREKTASGEDTVSDNDNSTTAKQDDETADDNGQPPVARTLGAGGEPSGAASTDFRSMWWGGNLYSFTVNQAPVMRLLYENWKAGTPDVGDETLLLAVDPEAPPARLSTLFRDHCAWGTLIVPGGSKGSHRLAEPDT
ncbi:hypothetical protein CA54_52830 [Symmachiella macrocystis]|uniref:Uncharacterized protein n=1 Tax=Symmachiella macrocystis TaxID=2527985 RepID=A0A5C6B5V8_9PLAN|nr:hypothetical protein [Symmachiella macrocystis]TWU06881.1 hypothetical protein CA54_52830 [Symmachiella macrocystis]